MSEPGETELQLSGSGVVVTNLKAAVFRLSVEAMSSSVIGIVLCRDLLFVSVLHQGVNVYRYVEFLHSALVSVMLGS